MKKNILVFIIFFVVFQVFGQEDAWVYFNDKPDAAYYFDNPLQMLSQRALDRRTRQNIELDRKDVPIYQQYSNTVAASAGITVMAKSKWMNTLHVRGTEEDIQNLTTLTFVDKIIFADKTLNVLGRPAKPKVEKVKRAQRTQQQINYGGAATQIKMLNGNVLHEKDYTGEGIVIAVMDGGFPGVDTAQPFAALRNNGKILGGYNFVGHSDNFYTAGNHGTLVLSSMGGNVEGQLVGTAPNASYYLFITEDIAAENPVEESYWVEAAETADSLGVDVINTSLGYFNYDNPAYSYTYEDIDGETAFISRGANIAFTKGMLCVTSAGNSGASGNPHIGVPADAFNTLAVGAVDSAEEVTYFSSRGPSYDQRVKPDVMALGYQAVLSDPSGSIIMANGTSFSSPITAGLVACLWQALPELTAAQLLQVIKESANRYQNPDNDYGYGIPDFNVALQKGLMLSQSLQKFILYPSPVLDMVNLSFPDDARNATLIFYNNLGQVVFQRQITRANPSAILPLPPGIYGYRIEAGAKSQWGRLLKQK